MFFSTFSIRNCPMQWRRNLLLFVRNDEKGHRFLSSSQILETFLIEGSNIEYGKIENCKIDTNLTSKIWRRVTSKKNDGNVEFSIENGKIETVTSNLSSTYLTSTVKRGQTGSPVGSNGVIASPIIISKGPPHPPPHGGPRLTPFLLSMLNKSMINSMLPLSMLTFSQSMFPYSILVTFPVFSLLICGRWQLISFLFLCQK